MGTGPMGTGMTRLNLDLSTERCCRAVLVLAGMMALAVVGLHPTAAQVPAGQTTAAQPATAKAKAKTKAAAPAQQDEAAEAGEGDAKSPQKPKKRDPAEAQRSIENGIKLLQSGKSEQAIGTFSAVVSGGNLPPPVMAKALYHRGLAYRKVNKPAQAISDLTSALWLKGGLVETERADALQARSAAYREAGLPDQSSGADSAGTAAVAAPTASRTERREASSAKAASALTTAATSTTQPPAIGPAQSASLAAAPVAAAPSGGGNFFSNLFGGSSTATAAAPPQATQPPPAPKTDVGQAWSSTTRIQSQRAATPGIPATPSPQQVAAAAPAPQATVAASTSAGRFKAQVALVRSAEEAQAVVAKLKAQYAAALAQREPAVDQTTFGNMGAFFRVRVGPYASQAEAQGVCAGLKGSGLDCVPVSQ